MNILLVSISLFMFLIFVLYIKGYPILYAYMFTNVTSFSWIDPLISFLVFYYIVWIKVYKSGMIITIPSFFLFSIALHIFLHPFTFSVILSAIADPLSVCHC